MWNLGRITISLWKCSACHSLPILNQNFVSWKLKIVGAWNDVNLDQSIYQLLWRHHKSIVFRKSRKYQKHDSQQQDGLFWVLAKSLNYEESATKIHATNSFPRSFSLLVTSSNPCSKGKKGDACYRISEFFYSTYQKKQMHYIENKIHYFLFCYSPFSFCLCP